MLKLKRRKKPAEKRWEYKKGVGKKATVNNPNGQKWTMSPKRSIPVVARCVEVHGIKRPLEKCAVKAWNGR
jgi:hypothetical protein